MEGHSFEFFQLLKLVLKKYSQSSKLVFKITAITVKILTNFHFPFNENDMKGLITG